MKYMGSKDRHAKEILPHLLRYRKLGQWYVEPFVGGANMIDKMDGLRFGSDIHPYLIAMWRAVSSGWMPPNSVTEDEYNAIRTNKDSYDPALVGYVGFALSYGGKWFGGWCRDGAGKRCYVSEALRNAQKQFPKLLGVHFACGSYDSLELPQNCLIYCDPPYAGTTKYASDFNHDEFYAVCRNWAAAGHMVFVSEYSMPEDFTCIWHKEVASSLTKNTGGKKAVEKLFAIGL